MTNITFFKTNALPLTMFPKCFKLFLKLISNGRPDCFKLVCHIEQSYCTMPRGMAAEEMAQQNRSPNARLWHPGPGCCDSGRLEFRGRGCWLQSLGFCSSGLCSTPSLSSPFGVTMVIPCPVFLCTFIALGMSMPYNK